MSEPGNGKPTGRLLSLDAYRGFVMLAMASAGFSIPAVAPHFPDSQVWTALDHQLEHSAWEGCTFWDLIQPSFMFIVGVAMPFSYANRRAQGQSGTRQLAHAAWRSVVLVALGVFLASAWSKRTNFTFTNVLSQIGLGYTFVFLLLGRRPRIQLAAAVVILVGYGLLFAAYSLPDYQSLPGEINAGRLITSGFFAHWDKNVNAAAAFDRWFLNLFPRADGRPFVRNPEGYTTLNFVPSIATMLFGVLAGELLMSAQRAWSKVQTLLIAGALCIALGTGLDGTLCPIVKKIWTPTWVIFSTGWTCWLLAFFYGAIDVAGFRRWAFPLVVVGLNSIAMYLMAQLTKPFIASTLRTHLGGLWRGIAHSSAVDEFIMSRYSTHLPPGLFEGRYGPIAQSASVLMVLWLLCFWLYRRRIFLRI